MSEDIQPIPSTSAGLCQLPCPMPDIVSLVGGKWKLIILQILVFDGTQRFGALKRRLDGVSQTMLTNQLRALESDRLITRKVYPEVPPRVEYSATPLAKDMEDVFYAMRDWWKRNNAPVDDGGATDGSGEGPFAASGHADGEHRLDQG